MGDEFVRAKTEQFKHGQDRSHKEFKQETLLTLRPELVGEAFSCALLALGKVPPVGSKLLLSDTGTALVLDAEGNGGRVGVVSDTEAQGLRDLMAAAPDCQGMLEVTIHETMDGFGAFTVRVVTAPVEGSEE